MKEASINLYKEVIKKYRSLDRWKRNLIKFCIIVFCISCFLRLINIGEWWHWNEWMEHIKSEHL